MNKLLDDEDRRGLRIYADMLDVLRGNVEAFLQAINRCPPLRITPGVAEITSHGDQMLTTMRLIAEEARRLGGA
jgi:hypothetical protein